MPLPTEPVHVNVDRPLLKKDDLPQDLWGVEWPDVQEAVAGLKARALYLPGASTGPCWQLIAADPARKFTGPVRLEWH